MSLDQSKLEIDIQTKFEELLRSKFPSLQSIHKWKQTMWHNKGKLIVSLIFLSKKLKFCFFNNPDLSLDKLQRWSSTIYSQNLEFEDGNLIQWEKIEELIKKTIDVQSK